MQVPERNREPWIARLACLTLVAFAVLQPLPAIAALVTWASAIALAGTAAAARSIGRLG